MLAPTITSRRNPLVSRFRAAAAGDDHTMLLEGAHLVSEALDAGAAFEVVACVTDRIAPDLASRLRSKLSPERLVAVTSAVLEALSPVRTPSGIVALAARPRWTVDDIVRDPRALVVVAVDVQDPGNLGAMVRSAEAGGATAVLTTGRGADPFGWKALRGSMGSALRLPLARLASLDAAIDTARAAGCQVVAAEGQSGTALYDADLRPPSVVLLGSEGEGLGDAALGKATCRVTIPMEPPVESLNVAVAAALIVYEARRQRRGRL